MKVINAKSALKALQRARELDSKATGQYIRAGERMRKGNFTSGHKAYDLSEANANKAAELFRQVEAYLEQLT